MGNSTSRRQSRYSSSSSDSGITRNAPPTSAYRDSSGNIRIPPLIPQPSSASTNEAQGSQDPTSSMDVATTTPTPTKPLNIPELPIEVISAILFYLPRSTLPTVALVNKTFRQEAEYHLYRAIFFTDYLEYERYERAVWHNPHFRPRLRDVGTTTGVLTSKAFIYFGHYFDNLPIRTIFTKPSLIDSRAFNIPNVLTRRLAHEIGPVVEETLGFAANSVMKIAGPLIAPEGVVPPHVFKDLEVLKCEATDLALLLPGHPVKDIYWWEWVHPPSLRGTYIQTLTLSSVPLRALSIYLRWTSPSLLSLLAETFPSLEILEILDDLIPPEDGRDVDWDPENDTFVARAHAQARDAAQTNATANRRAMLFGVPKPRPIFTAFRLETLLEPLRALNRIVRITYSATYVRDPKDWVGIQSLSLVGRFAWKDKDTPALMNIRVHHVELIREREGGRDWKEVVHPFSKPR